MKTKHLKALCMAVKAFEEKSDLHGNWPDLDEEVKLAKEALKEVRLLMEAKRDRLAKRSHKHV